MLAQPLSAVPATPVALSNSPVCTGSTLSLSTTAVSGAIYSWTGPNGFSSSLQNPTISNITTTESGTYSLTVTVNGCTSLAGTTFVTVNATPAAPSASSNSPVCAGSTLNLSTPNVSGATYSWTGPNGFTSTVQNPSISGIATSGTGTYSVTVTVNGCTSSAGTTTVTVNPIPATPVAGSNSPLCVGQSINLTSNTITGATYSWTGPGGFNSSLQNPTIANATAGESGTYSVTATVNGCTSLPGTVPVTVNSAPPTPVVGSNSPVCSGNSIFLTADTIPGATYTWTGPDGFSSSLQNPTISNVTTLATGTYTLIADNGCASTPASLTVTVNQTPAAPTISSNSPVCVGSNINLSSSAIAGATYSWTGPNGFTSSLQNPSVPGATTADAGSYSLAVTVNGCTSPSSATNVNVNTIPAVPSLLSNSPVCTGNTLLLSTGAVSGATYSWSGPNGFSSSLQNPSVSNVTLAANGTYSLVVTVNGCSGSAGTTNVSINQTPAAPAASNNGPLCDGDPLNLSAVMVAGATYSWTGPNGFSSSSQNPSIPAVTLADGGTYSVTVTVDGCTGPAGTTIVVVNPIPLAPTAGSNSPLCVGGTLNLTSNAVSGATYSWNGPNGFISALQNPSISSVTTSETGNYDVTVTVNGCTSPAGTVFVTVNSAPSTPVVSSNSPVCTGGNIQLETDTIPGATYSWSGPNGFTSSLQNPIIPGAIAASAGTYTVIANNGCASSPASVTVVVNSTPAAPSIITNAPVCLGSNITLDASAVAGGTYSWSGPNGFASSNQNNTINGSTQADSGNYTVTVTVNGCTSVPSTANIIVNTPAVADAGTAQTVCANNSAVILNGSVTGGSSTGTWTTSGTGNFSPSVTDLNAAYQPSNADTSAGSVVLTLTSTNNGACSASVSSVTITITDAPVANAGSNVSVCANNPNVTLSGSVSVSTGGYWSTSGTGTFSPDSTVLNGIYNPSAADTTTGSVTLTLTTTGNGTCLAVSDVMVVTIINAPVVNAGPDQIVCLSSPDATLTGNIQFGAGTGIWSTSGTGTFSPSNTDLNATYIPGSADTTNGSVFLVLTSTNNGGCNAVTDTVKISYAGIPVVTAGADQTVCANNSLVNLGGSVTAGGSAGIWTTSGNGTFVPADTSLNAAYIPDNSDTTAGTVTLTLTSTNGCVAVNDAMTVTITDAPNVDAGTDVQACSNNPVVNINATISGGSSTGIWSTTGTGTISPGVNSLNITYSPSGGDLAAGNVTLVLTSTNNGDCNPVTDTVVIYYTGPPVTLAGPDLTICANTTAQLGGTVSGGNGTGIWTTSGSGSFTPSATDLNAIYIPDNSDTTAGFVTLTLTSTNNGGCLAVSDQVDVTITDAPVAMAGSDQSVCANNAVINLNGSVSTATGGTWSTPGDGTFADSSSLVTTYTPGITDILNGNVTLILTTTGNGLCNAVTDTTIISITPAPVVDAGTDIFICTGTMTANLNGSVSGGSVTGAWTSSGTGTFAPSSTDLNGNYNLSTADTTAGSVTLILSSTNNGACNAVYDTVEITITTVPSTSAGLDQTVCANNSAVTLMGNVTGGSGNGFWTTAGGDGTFMPDSSSLNAVYQPGTGDTTSGSVMLILSPSNACLVIPDTVILTITPAPAVDAGADQTVCGNGIVDVIGTINSVPQGAFWSTTGSGSFVNDSSLVTGYIPGPSDTAAGGIYLVLTTYGNGLCMSVKDSMLLTVGQTPDALFTNGKVCTGESIQFTDLSASGIGSITEWDWDFGTGDTSSLQNPSYIFSTAGTYNVTLVVTSSQGCTDTTGFMIHANPSPVASFSTSVSCNSNVVSFTDLSSVTGGSVTGWSWDFDDGNNSSVQNPSNAYLVPGSYSVTLEVTTDSACSATSVQMLNLAEPLVAGFTSTGNCSPVVSFNDTTTLSGDTISSWAWSFGDGNTASSASPVHTFSSPGTYTVMLVVSTVGGCTDTVIQSIEVALPPVAEFSPSSGSFNSGSAVSFNDMSTGAVSWNWNFGNNDSSNVQNPVHTFNTEGEYNITLTVTNSGGCIDSVTHTIDIIGGAVAVPSAFTPNNDGHNDLLFVRGGPFSELQFEVYNEWGNKIFSSADQNTGWDGTCKGQPQPAGTYIYIVKGVTVGNAEINLQGDVTIIR